MSREARLSARAAERRAAAIARHPSFDAARFDALAPNALRVGHERPDAERDAAADAYLALLADATASDRRGPVHELLFAATLTGPSATAPQMARAYNLADGLMREHGWLADLLARELAEVPLERFEAALVEQLERVLGPARGAWPERVYATSVSLRDAVDDLVPGTLELVAPRVIRARDVDDPSRCAGVVVLDASTAFATPAPPGPALAVGEPVDIGGPDRFTVAGRSTYAFGLRRASAALASPAPFVAAIAEDSQYVWIFHPWGNA